MATGIVFVYLLIAALIAPVVWVMWWAFSSLGDRRGYAASAPAQVGSKTRFAFPSAADVKLPLSRGAITIYSVSGEMTGSCEGPDARGKCPQVLEDGTVPCGGRLLALPRPIRGSLEWQVPSGYRSCVLGSYGVYRRQRS